MSAGKIHAPGAARLDDSGAEQFGECGRVVAVGAESAAAGPRGWYTPGDYGWFTSPGDARYILARLLTAKKQFTREALFSI